MKQFAEKNKILKGNFCDFKIKSKLDSGDFHSDFLVVNVDKKKRYDKNHDFFYFKLLTYSKCIENI